MAKLVFGMNQSLDGYVDHMAFAPSPTLFRHFIEEAQGQAGSVYGRQMYEVMRYWDDDHPEWDSEERAFAAAWRNQPKWIVSRSLKSVGLNARVVEDDLEDAIRDLKAERDGNLFDRVVVVFPPGSAGGPSMTDKMRSCCGFRPSSNRACGRVPSPCATMVCTRATVPRFCRAPLTIIPGSKASPRHPPQRACREGIL